MAERKISSRKWPGNDPEGDDWRRVGETDQPHDGVRWSVWLRDPASNWRNPAYKAEWQSVKVTAICPVVIKANYHIGWNGNRLGGKRDLRLLTEYRPDLEAAVVAVLAGAA